MQDAVVAIDRDHRVVEANLAVERLFGHPRDAVLGQDLAVLLPEGLGADHRAYVENAADGGETRHLNQSREVAAEDARGRRFPISIALDHLTVDGEPYFVAVVRDVTEETERRRELLLRRDELQVQAKINQSILHARDVDTLLDGVLSALVELQELDVDCRAGAFLADGDRRVLALARTAGDFDAAFLEAEREVPYGACLCGRAAVSREVITSVDCGADARRDRPAALPVPHGHIIVPLVTEDDLVGVIALYTNLDPAWDDRRRELFETLGITIASAIRRLQVEADLRASRKALLHMATHDALTGCPNRRLALERLRAELSRCGRTGDAVSVVLLDLDHFKRINDTFGHLGGDAVLREVARRLEACVREYDICGRFGGEEFIVVLPGSTIDAAAGTAERLRKVLAERPVDYREEAIAVRASCGVASCVGGGKAEELLRAADTALYRAKDAGRDRIEVAGATP